MGRWLWTALVAGTAGVAAALGAGPAGAGGGGTRVEPDSPACNRFLFFAVFEGACEDALPDAAVKAALEMDEKGRYRHFVYACPVCSPVVEGLRAYAMRHEICFSRKGDPLLDESVPSPVADLAANLAGGDPAAKGAALKSLVERWVNRRMDRLRLTDAERAEWRHTMEVGRKKGMGLLPRSEGFEHKSCPSCDGAWGNEFGK